MNKKQKELIKQIKELLKTKDPTSPEVRRAIEEFAATFKSTK
jgi:hypothetical protein